MAQATSLDALPCARPGALHASLSRSADSFTLWDAAIDTWLSLEALAALVPVAVPPAHPCPSLGDAAAPTRRGPATSRGPATYPLGLARVEAKANCGLPPPQPPIGWAYPPGPARVGGNCGPLPPRRPILHSPPGRGSKTTGVAHGTWRTPSSTRQDGWTATALMGWLGLGRMHMPYPCAELLNSHDSGPGFVHSAAVTAAFRTHGHTHTHTHTHTHYMYKHGFVYHKNAVCGPAKVSTTVKNGSAVVSANGCTHRWQGAKDHTEMPGNGCALALAKAPARCCCMWGTGRIPCCSPPRPRPPTLKRGFGLIWPTPKKPSDNFHSTKGAAAPGGGGGSRGLLWVLACCGRSHRVAVEGCGGVWRGVLGLFPRIPSHPGRSSQTPDRKKTTYFLPRLGPSDPRPSDVLKGSPFGGVFKIIVVEGPKGLWRVIYGCGRF